MIQTEVDSASRVSDHRTESDVALSMTADDFMTGILAALALREHRVLDGVDRKFDESMAAAYRLLVDEADEAIDVDFQIAPDPVHGDSTVVQESLSVAIQGRIASRLNPTFRNIRITVDSDRAHRLLDRLPGGDDLYSKLADAFLGNYSSVGV